MPELQAPEPHELKTLRPRHLDEVMRQLRSTRNDIMRYGVWNIRNMTDEEFNRLDDRRLLGYFRQDLLETRFLSKGRRVDIIQLWHWFDDQMSGIEPMLVDNEEVFLNVHDKDLDKVRRRIAEIQTFLPGLRSDDLESFKRVKYKLRRTVMRLTYDLHHLFKRMERYRKNFMPAGSALPADRLPLEAVADIPDPPEMPDHEHDAGEAHDAHEVHEAHDVHDVHDA